MAIGKAKHLRCTETLTESELPLIYGLARQYAISDLWFFFRAHAN